MKDGPEEIASVMNLILPLNEQLPTGGNDLSDFKEQFLTRNPNKTWSVKEDKISELKEKFKGRISYLISMKSDVRKIFQGRRIEGLSHFIVAEDFMSEFQTRSYIQAFEEDKNQRKFYINSRQASLFVFPDGSYGTEGFKKYIIKKESGSSRLANIIGKKINAPSTTYSLSRELELELKDNNTQTMLNKLSKFSSKYAATISNILTSYREGKSSFVYCEFVTGSGAILFSLILKLFGFTAANGSENTEAPRYTLFTGDNLSKTKMTRILNKFNSPENMNGQYINVVIGSKVISEGFTFKNIQVENILTPHWNYSETSQAIARGWRLGSHKDLIESGQNPTVNIFQRVSIPLNFPNSIDLDLYKISERKDISIKHIERLMKEAAFDCALNYKRNFIQGYDGERDCDYVNCEYICDGIPPEILGEELSKNQLDYSTYQLYYSESTIKKIISDIKDIFKIHFKLNLTNIINMLTQYSHFDILTALRIIINESITIYNKFGFPSYLKEECDLYFLIDSLSVSGNYFSEYYTKFPTIKVQNTFNDIVDIMYYESLPNIIQMVCSAQDYEELRKIMIKLPLEIQEYYLEGSIQANLNNIEYNKNTQELILNYFKDYYAQYNDEWISWFLYNDKDIIRCLKNNVWKNCSPEYEEIIKTIQSETKEELEQNEYGYYGLYNRDKDTFCIKDIRKEEEGVEEQKGDPMGGAGADVEEKKSEDLRKTKAGKVCKTWDKLDLIKILTEVAKVDPPNDDKKYIKLEKTLKKKGKEDFINSEKSNKYFNTLIEGKEDQITTQELLRLIYWSKAFKEGMCGTLKDWFERNGLLKDDPNCGIQQGRKKS